MSAETKSAYRVEADSNNPGLGHRGKVFWVVGPDDTKPGSFFDDAYDANEACAALNEAFRLGAETRTDR